MKSRTLLQAAGVAAFVLFRLYGSAIAHPSELRMHTPVPITNFALSLIVNLFLATLVFALIGNWIEHRHGTRWLRLFLPGAVAALLIKVICASLDIKTWPPLEGAIFLGTTIVAIILHLKWERGEQALYHWIGAILVGMGIFSVFVVMQLARIAAWRPVSNMTASLSAVKTGSASHSRIVWILFDELSYQQTFGDRYPNLRLPNFDGLRASSTLFTHTQPLANDTELAIPSILLGNPVIRVDYTFQNKFQVTTAEKRSFHFFDAAQTPFAEARQHGLTTGIVGWYNPYCSMLAPYLNLCYWTSEEEIPQQFGIRDGFWKDLASPWMHSMTDAFHPHREKQLARRRLHTYKDLLQHSDQALEGPDPDFILLHLPLPHPPGFYNRETERFDVSGSRSYIDNLALADKTLGQLLTILRQSPRWNNTTVIVSGDHSWRTWLWSPTPSWTAEDQAASHGRTFDSRPMLMVHLAGQIQPATVSGTFPLLGIHDILEALIQGKRPSFSVPAP